MPTFGVNVVVLRDSLLWWHRERIFDALQAEQTVARKQDAQWPFAGINYEEGKQLVSEGKLLKQHLVDQFCKKPADADSHLEISGIK